MNKTAVLVDGSAITRANLRSVVENLGYKVLAEGTDSADAVNLYKSLKPMVVTLDIALPDRKALAALREIVAFDGEANIVVVSGVREKETVLRAISAGARDFVLKPFNPERIARSISSIEKRAEEKIQEKNASKKLSRKQKKIVKKEKPAGKKNKGKKGR